MMSFRDRLAKQAYYKIKNGIFLNEAIISAIEMVTKKRLTDRQKSVAIFYADKIRSGEMSFDEYWSLYKTRISLYEKNV